MSLASYKPSLKDFIRPLVPRLLLTSVRFIYILHRLRGHSRRDVRGFCVDAKGAPIPWMTYPAIDFLDSYDFSGASVFEFGMGSSSLYWAQRARKVSGVEVDPEWHRRIKAHNLSNLETRLCQELEDYPATIHAFGEGFDVVVVDGAERNRCVQAAVERLNPGGIIVVDNTEWYPHTSAMLREKGFTQIDFCGFTPLNSFTSMTSVFFRDGLGFPYRCREKGWYPVGGTQEFRADDG